MARGIVPVPGVYDSITALAAQSCGFKAAYISGAALTNSQLGVPDIGLATLNEFASQAARICQASQLPIISDADTGFGEAWNVARTVIEFERAGLAGLHLEDQVMPKRCGHLDGKALVSCEVMVEKIRSAVTSKNNSDFLIIARTDSKNVEGLSQAIERAKAYVQAGADMIFPEGLETQEEFADFRKSIDVPLLANMTEFGKTPLISVQQFEQLGYNAVIFPVSAMRIALKAVTDFYKSLYETGSQADSIEKMMTRSELYDLVEYRAYQDQDITWTNRK